MSDFLATLTTDLALPLYETWSKMIDELRKRENWRPDWRKIVLYNESTLSPGRMAIVETYAKHTITANEPCGLPAKARDRFKRNSEFAYAGDYYTVVTHLVTNGIDPTATVEIETE